MIVDGITEYDAETTRGLPSRKWCHLVSTVGEDELHEFAARLGMKRSWAQLRPKASQAHYDLTTRRRAVAIRMGAISVDARRLVQLNYDGMARRGLLGSIIQFAADNAARDLALW